MLCSSDGAERLLGFVRLQLQSPSAANEVVVEVTAVGRSSFSMNGIQANGRVRRKGKGKGRGKKGMREEGEGF